MRTKSGEKIAPINTIMLTTITKAIKAVFTSFQKSWRFFVAKYSENTGTRAALLAPSAANSLNILGILKAIKNDWASQPVPKTLAIRISLKKPRRREKKVPALMMEADLTNDFLDII